MRAITLTQPWASLVAIGAKRIETRSWSTSYRGPLAIHAAKGFPGYAKDLAKCRRVMDLLSPHLGPSVGSVDAYMTQMPLGCVVATCNLVDVLPSDSRGCLAGVFEDYPSLDTDQERDFGNYEPGRWCFVLENVVRLPVPVPARGSLSLWEWEPEGALYVSP